MLRVGIAGMGYGAAVHLPVFMTHPGVEVAALADNGSGRAAELCQQHGLKAQIFSSGEDMVLWPGLDAVSLAVPALQQSTLVRKALASGKHVLCEKPFGVWGEDIGDLDAISAERHLIAALGYEYRYDSALRRAIRMVQDGEVGTVSHIDVAWLTSGGLNLKRPWSWRCDRAAAGGVLVDWCCHVIDYCHLMLRQRASEVSCTTAVLMKERLDKIGEMRAVTAPDQCDLQLFFPSGVIARIAISNVEPAGAGHSVEVFGTKGRLRFHHAPPFNALSRRLVLQRLNEPEALICAGDDGNDEDLRITGFKELTTDFIAAIHGGMHSSLLPTLADGEAVWRVLLAAQCSIDQGCRVTVKY